jgi:hypothetical protein
MFSSSTLAAISPMMTLNQKKHLNQNAQSAFLLESPATTKRDVSNPVPGSYDHAVTAWQRSQRLPLALATNRAHIQQPFLLCKQRQLTHFSLPDGTHLAAIVGGSFFGIAKKTTIHCVKVFDEESDNNNIISGISKVIDAVKRPSVILIALISVPSESYDQAVCVLPFKCDHPASANMRPTGEKCH